jgi:hypothetical protein
MNHVQTVEQVCEEAYELDRRSWLVAAIMHIGAPGLVFTEPFNSFLPRSATAISGGGYADRRNSVPPSGSTRPAGPAPRR